jgi:hypothetical protein
MPPPAAGTAREGGAKATKDASRRPKASAPGRCRPGPRSKRARRGHGEADPAAVGHVAMARAVIDPNPRPRLGTSSTWTRARISSCILSSAPVASSSANAPQTKSTVHVGAGGDAARHRQECGHRPDGRRIDPRVRPGNHQVPARCRIGAPLVGPCGQDPRKCGRDCHAAEEENERMRELEHQRSGRAAILSLARGRHSPGGFGAARGMLCHARSQRGGRLFRRSASDGRTTCEIVHGTSRISRTSWRGAMR